MTGGQTQELKATGISALGGLPDACTAQPGTHPSSLSQAVLGDTLRGQLRQHIVQVVGVRVAMATQVCVHLGLVVDLIPHHRVALTGCAGGAHCENQASLPSHPQELQDLEMEREKPKLAFSS